MADGVNVDWTLAKPQQNFTKAYGNAFGAGRQMAREMIPGNAIQSYVAGPKAQMESGQQPAGSKGVGVLPDTTQTTGDLQIGASPGARSRAPGDILAVKAQIDALPEQERPAAAAQVQAHNEAFAHILIGLKSYPPEQRLNIAQHIAQRTGLIDPARVTKDDVTDAGIQSHLAIAMGIEQYTKDLQRKY